MATMRVNDVDKSLTEGYKAIIKFIAYDKSIGKGSQKVKGFSSLAVLFLCAVTAVGGEVLQFTAKRFTATAGSVAWTAVDSRSVMISVHAATNGWSLAVKDGGAVCFDNGASSPLGFPDSATNTIACAFAVVENAVPSEHATLFDAPCSIRFVPILFDDNATRFYQSQLTNAVALSVNGTETNGFTATTLPQLVEAVFDAPCALNDLYIGGAPATAAWTQSWGGGISELIFLAEAPSEEVVNAIRRYLSIKHGMAIPTASDAGIATLLVSMGIDTGGFFDSVFLVR